MFFNLIPLCSFFLPTQSTMNSYFICWVEKLTSGLLIFAEWEKSTFCFTCFLKLILQALSFNTISLIALFHLILFRLLFDFFCFLSLGISFCFLSFWRIVSFDFFLRFFFSFIIFFFFWRLRLLLNLRSLM